LMESIGTCHNEAIEWFASRTEIWILVRAACLMWSTSTQLVTSARIVNSTVRRQNCPLIMNPWWVLHACMHTAYCGPA
jgi:hypothetical protein